MMEKDVFFTETDIEKEMTLHMNALNIQLTGCFFILFLMENFRVVFFMYILFWDRVATFFFFSLYY